MITTTQNWKNILATHALAPVEILSIDGYSRVFTTYPIGLSGEAPWIKEIGTLQQEAQVPQGASTLSDLTVTVNDQSRYITADRASFTFEGKMATIKTGFRGLALNDYVTVATMLINKVRTDLDNTVYVFNLTDFSRLLQRTVYRTADDGRPTSNSDPKIIGPGGTSVPGGNPMDILVDVLQNELGLRSDMFSLKFDGTDDYVKLAQLDNWGITNQVTLSAWVNTNTKVLPNGSKIFMTLGEPDYLSFYQQGFARPYLSLSINNTQRTLDSNFVPEVDTWYHVAGTYDGDKLRIYVDGVLKNTSPSYPGNVSGLQLDNRFIGRWSSPGFHWSGLVDQVRVYNRALSGSEVGMLAVGGEPSVSGLVGYWRFEEGTGTSTADSSGKGNAGTLVGLPTWEYDVPDKLNQINFAAIASLKNTLFAGMKLRFELTTAPQAKDWIDKELFQALGGYGFWNNLGAFTPYFYIPQAVPTVALALTEYNVEGVPGLDQADPMNFITYRMDFEGDQAQQELTELYGPSFNLYGMQSQHIIEARGVRSFYQGLAWARLLAHALFRRYARKPPLVTATAFWDAAVLEVGDCVTLTHSKMVPPGGGTLGVTNELFEVVKLSKDFTKHTVELGLLDVNWLNGVAAYLVAPDTQVDWTLASPAEKAAFMFLASAATGNYSDQTPGHLIY